MIIARLKLTPLARKVAVARYAQNGTAKLYLQLQSGLKTQRKV